MCAYYALSFTHSLSLSLSASHSSLHTHGLHYDPGSCTVTGGAGTSQGSVCNQYPLETQLCMSLSLCWCRSTPNELFDPSVQEMRRRMEELAQKNRQRLASKQQPTQETENVTPPTQSSPSPVEEEVGPATQPTPPPPISPPPPAPPSPSPSLPPTPSPPPPPPPAEEVRETTPLPPPPRSETPLPTILLRELQAKDLGSTGFVTGNELSAILTQLSKGKAVSHAVSLISNSHM